MTNSGTAHPTIRLDVVTDLDGAESGVRLPERTKVRGRRVSLRVAP